MCLKIFKRKDKDMQYTDNLNLNLPESGDYIEDDSREAWNDNFETLDTNVVIKGDFAIVSGSLTISSGSRESSTTVSYPTGFSANNCVLLTIAKQRSGQTKWAYGNTYLTDWTKASNAGAIPFLVSFMEENITVRDQVVPTSASVSGSDVVISFKLVLMKIS